MDNANYEVVQFKNGTFGVRRTGHIFLAKTLYGSMQMQETCKKSNLCEFRYEMDATAAIQDLESLKDDGDIVTGEQNG